MESTMDVVRVVNVDLVDAERLFFGRRHEPFGRKLMAYIIAVEKLEAKKAKKTQETAGEQLWSCYESDKSG
jgi:hypothetical protein